MTRVYEVLLWLYPAELRRQFGAEMKELFREDLAHACGLTGLIGVWWCAFYELLRIALPSQRSNPAVVVPVIAFALHAMLVGAELTIPRASALRDVAPAVIWSSLVVALTALVVVHSGKVRVLSIAG